jgi:hypothetical protein
MLQYLTLPTAKAEGFCSRSDSHHPAMEPRRRPTEFQADELWRGGHPRFGTRPVPLSSVDTLACDLRPCPSTALQSEPSKRREKVGMHLIDTLVLLPAGAVYYGTQRNTIELSNVLLVYS